MSLYKAALAMSLFFIFACNNNAPIVKTGKEGKELPSFKVFSNDSATYSYDAVPNGQPVVLIGLSTHCPYCKSQMKEIINDMNQLKNIQFYIFLSDLPTSEINKFQNHFQLRKYSNIKYSLDYKKIFLTYFDIRSVPFLAVYGKNKRLNSAFLGKTDINEIKKAAFTIN